MGQARLVLIKLLVERYSASVLLKSGNFIRFVILLASTYNLVEFESLFLSTSERFKAVISFQP